MQLLLMGSCEYGNEVPRKTCNLAS